jgi:hypothetical protein
MTLKDNKKKMFYFPKVKVKVKVKGRKAGLYSTAALSIADCALAPNDVVHSFISRGATTPSGVVALY